VVTPLVDRGEVRVTTLNPIDSRAHLSIFDVLGRKIYETDGQLSEAPHSLVLIPFSSMPSGTYIVQLASSEGIRQQKFVW
jgi:hypothetical protein